jgi:O-antigen/teichoic acid export membrane protein
LGVIIKQSIQNTVISYIGIILGFISTILLFPRILTPDQYGLTRLLISLALVSSQFAHLGVKNIIIRYFPYFRSSEQSKARLLTLTLLIPLCGFLFFTLLYLLSDDLFITYYEDRSALFNSYYLYLIPLVFATLFFEVLNNYVRALQDSVTGSFLNEVLMRALIILLLITYYFEFISFTAFMMGFVGTYCIQPFYLLAYLYLHGELNFSYPKLDKRAPFVKGMGVYGAYSFLGGLATLIVGNIDVIMLGAMTNLNDTAVYAIAFYVGSVISVPQRSIIKIASPILANLLKENKFGEIDSLYKRTSLNQLIAGILLFIGIWANMHNLMYLLPEEYQGLESIVLIIGVAKLFNMATGINGAIIMNSKHFRFDLYTNILLIGLTITSNYFFIQYWGMLGAAIATALSIFIYNFIKFIFVWIKFDMQPFRWNALAVHMIAAICLGISWQIPYLYNFVIDLIVRSGIITIIFTGSILLFDLSDDVKNLLQEGYSRVQKLDLF